MFVLVSFFRKLLKLNVFVGRMYRKFMEWKDEMGSLVLGRIGIAEILGILVVGFYGYVF